MLIQAIVTIYTLRKRILLLFVILYLPIIIILWQFFSGGIDRFFVLDADPTLNIFSLMEVGLYATSVLLIMEIFFGLLFGIATVYSSWLFLREKEMPIAHIILSSLKRLIYFIGTMAIVVIIFLLLLVLSVVIVQIIEFGVGQFVADFLISRQLSIFAVTLLVLFYCNFVIYAARCENRFGIDAIRRSIHLIHNKFWIYCVHFILFYALLFFWDNSAKVEINDMLRANIDTSLPLVRVFETFIDMLFSVLGTVFYATYVRMRDVGSDEKRDT